jgi:hypothetical protein
MVVECNSAAEDSFEHTLVLAVRNPDEFRSSHRSELEMAVQLRVWRMTGGVLGYSVEYLYPYGMM